jgi:hypothetical protein
MENVAMFPGAEVPVDIMLEKAKEWGLKSVVIVGEDKTGALCYGMSMSYAPEAVFLLESAKAAVMDDVFK